MKLEVNPAYILVDYAWAVLSTNHPNDWSRDNYKGLVPIVPLGEEPELNEFTHPHIVYGYAESPTGPLHARNGGSMTFVVYDQKFRRLTKTMNTLRVAFERQDETARDINNFSTYYLGESGEPGPYLGIRFGWVDVGFVEGGTPEETDNGRQSASINIRYEYYVDYDVVTSVG